MCACARVRAHVYVAMCMPIQLNNMKSFSYEVICSLSPLWLVWSWTVFYLLLGILLFNFTIVEYQCSFLITHATTSAGSLGTYRMLNVNVCVVQTMKETRTSCVTWCLSTPMMCLTRVGLILRYAVSLTSIDCLVEHSTVLGGRHRRLLQIAMWTRGMSASLQMWTHQSFCLTNIETR